MTQAKLKQKLQKIFNEYIRLRDQDCPCISCFERKTLQAGHFFHVKGYDGLRFDEINTNGECAGCNCFNDSHLIGYADNLILKIGLDNVSELKKRADNYKKNGTVYLMGKKYDKFYKSDLLEAIEYYKQKIKTLK
jgi:hypothetical protein